MPLLTPADAPLTASGFLLDRFRQTPFFQALAQSFQLVGAQGTLERHLDQVGSLSVKALLVAALHQSLKQPVLFVSPDPQASEWMADALGRLLPPESIALYPVDEVSPYDLSVTPARARAEQLAIQQTLGDPAAPPRVLILSPKNLLLKHWTLAETLDHAIRLSVGDPWSPEDLAARCLALGYVRTTLIMDPGEFSSRGDIFDLYPVNAPPVRVECFGDTIESIRELDVDNQRSIRAVPSVLAIPRGGIVLTPEHRTRLEARLAQQLKSQRKRLDPVDAEGLKTTVDNQVQALAQDFWPDGIDYYGPLVHDPTHYGTLVDELPANGLLVLDDWQTLVHNVEGLADRLTRQFSDGIEKGRLLDLDFCYHQPAAEALRQLRDRVGRRLYLETFPTGMQDPIL